MRRPKLKPDPMGVPRHGLVVFCLIFLTYAGLQAIFGPTPSNAVNDAVDDNVELIWGGVLTIGSFSVLLGMFWPGDVRDGLLLKRYGYYALSVAAMLFGIIVLVSAHRGGILVAGLVFILGRACWVEYRRVNKRIERAKLESKDHP